MPDQTIEQRLDEILDFHALNHSYKSWSSKDEAKQALLQLLNEARIDENTISRDRFKEGWGKKWFESRIAQLTPKENIEWKRNISTK